MIETQWPRLAEDMNHRRDILDRVDLFFEFIGLLRVRVPAARDPVELALAHQVRLTAKHLQRAGKISTLPGLETLVDDMEIAIDPHQSIHAMGPMLQDLALLMNYVGFEITHNTTEERFITSDNPVIFFDPDVPDPKLLPYTIRPPKRWVELLLPISPHVIIRGTTEIPVIRDGMQPRHAEISAVPEVRRINRLVSRFGYRFIFAQQGGQENVVAEFAATSPTVRFNDVSMDGSTAEGFLSQMVFGARQSKPKWSRTRSA